MFKESECNQCNLTKYMITIGQFKVHVSVFYLILVLIASGKKNTISTTLFLHTNYHYHNLNILSLFTHVLNIVYLYVINDFRHLTFAYYI